MSKNANKNTTAETITGADVGSLSETLKGTETIAPTTGAPVSVPVKVTTREATGKSAIAQKIFDESYANYATDPKSVPQRKDILERCIAEAGLTPAGAATYLQNYKRKHGYSQPPATTSAPAAQTAPEGDTAE